jgi:hypothetical protein
MNSRQDLCARTEQSVVSDSYFANVQHYAVEVKEDPSSKIDVGAVVAIEAWLHPDGISAAAKQIGQQASSEFLFRLTRLIQGLAQISGTFSGQDKIRIERIV